MFVFFMCKDEMDILLGLLYYGLWASDVSFLETINLRLSKPNSCSALKSQQVEEKELRKNLKNCS